MLKAFLSHNVVDGVHTHQRVIATLERLPNTEQRRYVSAITVKS